MWNEKINKSKIRLPNFTFFHEAGLPVKTVMYVKERGKITNKEYQELTGVSRQMVTIALTNLVNKNVFKRIGKAGKGIAYQLTKLTNK